MWKTAFTLFILLASLISGMLFWQWKAYSEVYESGEEVQIEQVETFVTVKTAGKDLELTQLFTGLQQGKEYRISMPATVEQWTCMKENGEHCDSIDENPTSFISDNGELRLNYSIILDNDESPFLLSKFIGTLLDYDTLRTEIEIIDQFRRDGTWIAGLPLRGSSEQQLIDYYVFEGNVSSPSLYWQPTKLTKENGPFRLQYFYFNGQAYEQLPLLEKLNNFSGMTIIMTNDFSEMNGNGLMIVNENISEDLLQRRIVYNYFKEKGGQIALEERWLFDVLTALTTESESLIERGQLFIEELKNQLSDEQINKFLQLVMEEQTIEPKILDESLSTVIGKKTNYFSLNANEDTALAPLYFVDERNLFVNEELNEDIHVLMIDYKRYFPFVETLSALGFEVKVLADEETILIDKDANSYRFFVDQNIFIYNQEDYGLLANPLTTFNGKIYTESGWLESIFNVKIYENTEEIRLKLGYESP